MKEGFSSIKQQIDSGQIIPFYILKNYIYDKMNNNNLELEKLIDFYVIDDILSSKYLNGIDLKKDYIKFLEKFNKLKFSLSRENLNKFSNLLNQKDKDEQKEFISFEPSKMLLQIFCEIESIFNSKNNKNNKRTSFSDLINKYNYIYKDINNMVLFPTLIASENYAYNKSIFDFVHCIKKFLKKRTFENLDNRFTKENISENNDIDTKDNKTDLSNIKIEEDPKETDEVDLLNQKRAREQSLKIKVNQEDNEYVDYDNDDEFYESLGRLIFFLKSFQNVFKEISKNECGEENILKIRIIIFYLNCYEVERRPYDNYGLNVIYEILENSTINEQILEKYKIYNKKNEEINKSNWKEIKNDEDVNIIIGEETIKDIKIKYFNKKILDLEEYVLKYILKDYNINYLSIYGLKKLSILFKYPEIEKAIKNNLFNLISSDIVKEGFQIYDSQFNHSRQVYPFQGIYKKEIFEEIWENIIVIPFIYSNISSKFERTSYKLFLDLMPNIETNTQETINILTSKLIDLYHEIFHIITILYVTSVNEYKEVDFKAFKFKDNIKKNEIANIVNKYDSKYPNLLKVDYDLTAKGDIMEIYLFGIKPRGIFLYAAIYLSYLLEGDRIKTINIEDLRTKFSELTCLKDSIDIQKIKEYCPDITQKKIEIFDYFKNSLLWKICAKLFITFKNVSNLYYIRSNINEYNTISNISYNRFRKKCYPRKDKKK